MQQPSIVTQAKLEVEKNRRANDLSEKMDKIEQMRQKEREDSL